MTEVLIEQEQQELKQEALTVVERAKLVRVSDQATYNQASDLLLNAIVPFRKRIFEYWKPLTAAAWDTYKKLQNRFKEMDEPLEQAEKIVKGEIRKFDDEQEKIRAEQQRLAQEAAEKEAEEDKLRAAIVAQEAGATEEEVSRIIDTPLAVVAEPVATTYVRTSGISKREHWVAVVTNFHELVKAAAKDKSLLPYLEVNQSALNKRASADKSTLRIPGVTAKNDAIVSARAR